MPGIFSLRSLLVGLVAIYTASTTASPLLETRASQSGRDEWPHRLQALYQALGRRQLGNQRQSDLLSQLPCNLNTAVMPEAPIPLPSPAPGLALSHVTLGRGTQNYTCATDTSADQPKPVGAVATLFNVSCVAANYPELLSVMPAVALDFPPPKVDDNPDSASNLLLSGHHFFTDKTTPFFDLDTTSHQYGVVAVQKLNATDAPSDAPMGPKGRGWGSVPWLKLAAKAEEGMAWKEVYRVETAGGQPPETCEGQPPTFEVEYAAEYWLYN